VVFVFQDNVFVTVVASVQYRAHIETAEDAFYKLTNPREQIKAYVFDGKDFSGVKVSILFYGIYCIVVFDNRACRISVKCKHDMLEFKKCLITSSGIL